MEASLFLIVEGIQGEHEQIDEWGNKFSPQQNVESKLLMLRCDCRVRVPLSVRREADDERGV